LSAGYAHGQFSIATLRHALTTVHRPDDRASILAVEQRETLVQSAGVLTSEGDALGAVTGATSERERRQGVADPCEASGGWGLRPIVACHAASLSFP
jgi:hypothetical protein